MAKQVFCAQCGTELHFTLKALPKQQLTVTLIEPHTCPEETAENPFKDNNNGLVLKPKKKLDKKFSDFDFAKKLGGKDSLPTTTIFDDNSGDKRDQSDIKTIAPTGILDTMKGMINTSPEHDLDDL